MGQRKLQVGSWPSQKFSSSCDCLGYDPNGNVVAMGKSFVKTTKLGKLDHIYFFVSRLKYFMIRFVSNRLPFLAKLAGIGQLL